METNTLTLVLLPLAIAIIMIGLGLSLTIDDFKRVLIYPKAVIIGLVCQMLILPAVCFLIAIGFNLSPELAVGLMLLSAAPGGATANLYSHLAKGDVALNVSLTAVNSVLALFTLPFIVNFAIAYFMQTDQAVAMQFKKVIEVCMIVLAPVAIGMLVRSKSPALALKLDKPVKIASVIFLALIIVLAVVKERENIVQFLQDVGLAALVFNLLSMGIGYFVPQLFNLGKKQAVAIGMEIGIHNGTLAIYIALSVIGNSAMSIPAAVYSIIMFFTAALFGYWVSRGSKKIAS